MTNPLPASLTKHLDSVSHPLPRDNLTRFNLRQLSSSTGGTLTDANSSSSSTPASARGASGHASNGTGTTGTTLWLGGQVLACYLASLASPPLKQGTRPQAMELGAGVGYLSLVLASQGWDVVSTDIPPVLDIVLRPNIDDGEGVLARMGSATPLFSGKASKNPRAATSEAASTSTGISPSHGSRLDEKTAIPASVVNSTADRSVDNARLGRSAQTTPLLGAVTVRELDWVAAANGSDALLGLAPDLIVTSDTIYHPALVPCLYGTMVCLSRNSVDSGRKAPTIYLCLERRDSRLVDSALEAASGYGIIFKRIGNGRVVRCVEKTGWGWNEEDWEGVEVYRGRWTGGEVGAASGKEGRAERKGQEGCDV